MSPCIGKLLNQIGRLIEATVVHLNRKQHVELAAARHGLNADDVQAVLFLGEHRVAQGAPEPVHVETHEVLRGHVLEADGDRVLQHFLQQLLHVDHDVDGHLEAAIAHRDVQDVLAVIQPSEGNDLPVVAVDLEQTFLI